MQPTPKIDQSQQAGSNNFKLLTSRFENQIPEKLATIKHPESSFTSPRLHAPCQYNSWKAQWRNIYFAMLDFKAHGTTHGPSPPIGCSQISLAQLGEPISNTSSFYNINYFILDSLQLGHNL